MLRILHKTIFLSTLQKSEASKFQCSVELWEHNLAMLVYVSEELLIVRIYKRQHISGRESDINDGLLPQPPPPPASPCSLTMIELGPARCRTRGAQWRTN